VVGPHPEIAVANFSRPFRSKIVWNNSRGTPSSAIWKTIFREWRIEESLFLCGFIIGNNISLQSLSGKYGLILAV
jgi:hypothetical protein